MKLRNLAVVGLATTAYGRRLLYRQEPYGGNSTAPAGTAVVIETSTVTVWSSSTSSSSTSSLDSYESETSDTTSPVSPTSPSPYSSPRSSPSDYNSTTTATEYITQPSTTSIPASDVYSSQKYSYVGPSPVGPGTASSGYQISPPGPTAPPAYGPTGGSGSLVSSTSRQTHAGNATCSGATLNVLDASLDWWYTKTLYYPVSTFSIQFNPNDTSTGWTALPATTPFDVQSALAEPDCTSTPKWVPSANATLYDYSCTPAASPVAAETTIITQTAYKNPPAPTGNGTLPKLIVTPKPASISVSDATQEPYAQGTPFVFFSQYEIVSKSATVFGNGSAGCAEVTQAFEMAEAFSFEYTGNEEVNGSQLIGAGVTGDVNPALLGLVGQDTAVAGSWVAEPTVVLLMQEVFVAEAALAATLEPTASVLDTPTPTMPPYVTLAPTGPDGPPKITYSPRVESSQTKLQLPSPNPGDDARPTGAAGQTQGGDNGGANAETEAPHKFTSLVAFIAQIAHSEVTLQLPAAPTQTIVTASVKGTTVTATRLSAVQPTNGPGGNNDNNNNNNNGGGGNPGGLISAINSLVRPKPTNALDVLSQAEATFPGSNPTANAIIHGIGGPGDGEGSQAQEDNMGGGGGDGGGNGGGGNGGGNSGGNSGGNGGGNGGGNENGGGSGGGGNGGGNSGGNGGGSENGGSSGGANGGGNGGGNGAAGSNDAGSRAITVGGALVTPNAQTQYIVGSGQTLTPGGRVIVAGTTYSLDSQASAVVVNGVTQPIAANARATSGPGANIPLLTLGNPNGRGRAVITPNAATEYSLAPSATLTPGGSAVVAGTTYSLNADGNKVVVNGVTSTLAAPGANAAPITVGSALVTPNAATAYSLAPGQTLTPGGSAVVDGTTYALDSSGSELVVNGVTSTLAAPNAHAAAITVGPALVTPNAAIAYSLAPGQTLTPGGSAVVDGTTYALDSSGSELVVNGVTRTIQPSAAADGAGVTMAPVLTIGDHTFRPVPGGGTTYVIGGETLTMGESETVTVDGTTYVVSLAPSATRLVVGTENADGDVTGRSTQTLFPEQGSGAGATASGGRGPEQQTGNGAVGGVLLSSGGVAFALGSLLLAVWL